jgi:glucose/arabinose dehydrogenase
MRRLRGGMARRRAILATVAILLAVVYTAGPAPLQPSIVAAGGAPIAGTGSFDIPNRIRVIDGSTFDTWINGQEVFIRLADVNAPLYNAPCGRQATNMLRGLVRGGLHLEEEPSIAFDKQNRRVYRAFTPLGQEIAQALIQAGAVRYHPDGETRPQLAAAEDSAQRAKTGCVWQTVIGKLRAPSAADTSSAADEPRAVPRAATLPLGFSEEVIAAGLAEPTAFTWLPDGRILIAQKSGLVRVVKGGALLPTPFIDLTASVNDYFDHGLLGIAADPDFATNGFVYLLYTFENNPSQFDGTKTARLTRVTATGDVAGPATEVTIVGTQVGTSCTLLPAGADCIPSDGPSHSVGNIKFAADKTMFVTIGDSASFNTVDDLALRAQDITSLAGKMLHITRAGAGVPTNPFWNGDPNANRSKVWAYGIRNAYRFNLRPGTGMPYAGDVGWNTWEEIDAVPAGANLGWPCYEGNAIQAGYQPKAVCQSLYALGAGGVRAPILAYARQGVSAAATGGAFYSGTVYPAAYRGAYIYGDYGQDDLRMLRVDASDQLVAGSATTFATTADGPVAIESGPDQNIWYLSIVSGQLRRLVYTAGNTPPIAVASATPSNGLAPLNVQFSSAGTRDPDGDPLTYLWAFGDGTASSTLPNPTHTYSANGAYTAQLTANDGRGGISTASVLVTVGNRAPTATISAPTSTLTYRVGDVITYSGSATDPEDGVVPATGLAWQIILHHCPFGQCHTHFFANGSGTGGSFTVPDHGDDVFFEIILTATDSGGLKSSTSVSVNPQTVAISLTTSASGVQLVYDGTTVAPPFTRQTAVGSAHTIFAPSPQGTQTFATWSDGGAQQHLVTVGASAAAFAATFTSICAPSSNPIPCENSKPGNPESDWDINGAGSPSIQGFATDISVNKGATVRFKVNTPARAYRLDIYRLGYYGGNGARLIANLTPSAALPQVQPACLSDTATNLVDCGNWAESASWAVPPDAVSGIYIAKLVRTDATAGASHVVFIVRDDAGTSDLLFQTSDTTWQAYNLWGGASLYNGTNGRATKVSYNRPFNTREQIGGGDQTWLLSAEYPMVRWLESNGYNVSYTTGVDSDRSGSLIQRHKVFLSVGHDEYWSGPQRANVEAARATGVSLAFFSGNELFWKTRWETSTDASHTAYRTLVTYKETDAGAKIDPDPAWTGTWRDPRLSPPADGGRPENALSGTMFMVNGLRTDAITVPAADGKMRFWRNTSIATLAPGATATLPAGTLGYEWDADVENASRPAGLVHLSTTTVDVPSQLLLDYGSTFGPGRATHSLTLYRHASGALVFSAGSVQWSWGLDATHDIPAQPADPRMQQATVNLFADMNVQPGTLAGGLVAAARSTDTVAPRSTIASPAAGATITGGRVTTISGTATDTGGGVIGAVEVSVDGGTTWHAATGRASWTYAWTPGKAGQTTILVRAADDSANRESAGPSVNVTIACPCSAWDSTATPLNPSQNDASSVEVGVRFRADVDGDVTGIRFYKGSLNTGTHVGSLWTATGTLLGRVTFSGESATGWQQASLATPVHILANTTYIVSYLAPQGGYALNTNYFATTFTSPPLRLLASGVDGPNGLFLYTPTSAFPTQNAGPANYWVDVVFNAPFTPDITPPVVTAVQATAIMTNTASIIWTTNEPADGQVEYGTTTAYGTLTALAPALVTSHTQALSGLAANTTYHFRVRTRDAAGNLTITPDAVFTTQPPDTTPPTVTGRTPVAGATRVGITTSITATFSEPVSSTTIVFSLRDAAGTVVPTTLTYDGSTTTAALHPNAALATSTTYTATLSGAADLAGNVMTAVTWSFTTQTANSCPCTIWSQATTPAVAASGDTGAVELGVKFRSDVAGTITGLRFYKGAGNGGTHVGNLWSATGTLLASATFSGETASGWQEVTFATPVSISPNTTYVASYFAPVGRYSTDSGYFAGRTVTSGPLRALADGTDGGNGIYRYGAASGFPTGTFNATNYWIDIVFR